MWPSCLNATKHGGCRTPRMEPAGWQGLTKIKNGSFQRLILCFVFLKPTISSLLNAKNKKTQKHPADERGWAVGSTQICMSVNSLEVYCSTSIQCSHLTWLLPLPPSLSLSVRLSRDWQNYLLHQSWGWANAPHRGLHFTQPAPLWPRRRSQSCWSISGNSHPPFCAPQGLWVSCCRCSLLLSCYTDGSV